MTMAYSNNPATRQVVRQIIDSVGDGLAESLCLGQAVRLEKIVESPIELILGTMFLVTMKLSETDEILCLLKQNDEFDAKVKLTRRQCVLVPQYKWSSYRSDFLILTSTGKFLIECDGHDYHERTKEQAARDRKRDREAQRHGYMILRFTGSEIFAGPFLCAAQILEALLDCRTREEAREK